jgi:hypothetical protein
VTPKIIIRREVSFHVVRRELLAGPALFVEEVLPDSVQAGSNPSRIGKLRPGLVVHKTEDILPENLVSPMTTWSTAEKRFQPALNRFQSELESCDARPNGIPSSQVTRTSFEKSRQRLGRNQAPVQQSFQAHPNPALWDLRKHEGDGFLLPRYAATDSQRVVQSLLDVTRRFGLVGHCKTGLEIGFEREFPKQ